MGLLSLLADGDGSIYCIYLYYTLTACTNNDFTGPLERQ